MSRNGKVNGYITLVSVLVVGSIALASAVSLLLLGIDASRTALTNTQAAQARSLANTCAEVALDKLRQDTSYQGNETITFSNGSCTIATLFQSGSSTSIQLTAEVSGLTRKSMIQTATLIPQVQLESWQEVADF